MSRRKAVYSERKAAKKPEYPFWPIANHAFNHEWKPILDSLSSDNISPELRLCLKNYLVISLVSTIEKVFWNLARYNIDKFSLDTSNIVKDQVTIPLSVLDMKKQVSITKGKIIASSFNFANPKDIEFFFSHLLHLQFFESIKLIDKNDPYNYVK